MAITSLTKIVHRLEKVQIERLRRFERHQAQQRSNKMNH
jgi:hypothetical protein